MLNTKVVSFITGSGVDLNGKELLCCVSGGADSMALLYHFHTNSSVYGLKGITACHFNHSMRGIESLNDEKVVSDYCSGLGIELIKDRLEDHFDIDHLDHSENTLRKLRYQFFENAAVLCKADYIVTAHNLNDNVETVFFRIARGTGLKGMSGIPPVRGNLLRPFLCVSRKEIEDYCFKNDIPFVTDSSNLTDDYKRNLIRHKIMSVFPEINKEFLEAVNNLIRINADADSYFQEEAERILRNDPDSGSVSTDTIKNAKPPLNEYIIMQMVSSHVKEITGDIIDRCLKIALSGGQTEVSKNCYFIADNKKCFLKYKYTPQEFGPFTYDELRKTGQPKEFIYIDELEMTKELYDEMFYSCVDYDKLNGVPQVRNRRNGDQFSSAYRKNTKSIKKLFNEKGYSAPEKDAILFLTDDDGIVWVEGEGPATGKEIDLFTKRVIRYYDRTTIGGQNV